MTEADTNNLLYQISELALASEQECVEHLLLEATPYLSLWPQVRERASVLIQSVRSNVSGVSVEAFLQEYGLSSKEGVAVMCLAEALLRIPDRHTADKLIESTFDGAQWEKHLGSSESLWVNASSWGLLLTGKMLQLEDNKEGVGKLLGRLAHRASEPVIRTALKAAMKLIASQFVLAETIEESVKKASAIEQKGYRFSYDMLGEGARSFRQAERYFESYLHAIKTIAAHADNGQPIHRKAGISIKLTALHPRYEWRQKDRVMTELLPKLKQLIAEAKAHQLCVMIDAEEAARLDLELELFAALFCDPDFSEFEGIGFVLQAYQKRAYAVLDYLIQLHQKTGKRMPIRLVKGAYWDSEIKRAQLEGLPDYPVFTVKAHSDLSYMVCAQKILQHPAAFYPQFATHNAVTVAAIMEVAGEAEYEFQRLFGMGEALYDQVLGNRRCCIYAPIGEHKDLLAYLIRRLLENGANNSFVHRVMDTSIPVESLLDNPVIIAQHGLKKSPLAKPVDLYSDRKNSRGFDTGYRVQIQALLDEITRVNISAFHQPDARAESIGLSVKQARQAFTSWNVTPVETRAQILERTADLLEHHRADALAWCIQEGKKTIIDAIAEWRESIDFCRYYATQARKLFATDQVLHGPTGERNVLRLKGRGVFVCISPWNFPLAIFIGQVAAALAAGNSVIAKPAEQTPGCAAFMVSLLHKAGVPADVVQLVTGAGETVGAALVQDERIAGVAFTGSTQTAKRIQRTLADRTGSIIPLIAETGGQNAMIVDSSALLEQVVDDVLLSAFGSAGQRCSALRVLYIQQEIAADFKQLLADAMQSLVVGDPADLATDIGPVIDQEAQQQLLQHIVQMKQHATWLCEAPQPREIQGTFVVPHAFEIASIDLLKQEVFGPILHLISYNAEAIDRVIDDINATGYGLTFGVHSRIPSFYESLPPRIAAGNIYINRSMIGATVGVQPFGGEGLSGTGPKAGGPYTLLRYATEQTVSTNTAAIGGNIHLLMT